MRTVFIREVETGRELCFLLANLELARKFTKDLVDALYAVRK